MRKLPPMLRAISAALAALALAGCGSGGEQTEATSIVSEAAASVDTGPKPQLGLMTSLPLYWPLGADFGEIASGEAQTPWQRLEIEQTHEIVPLDTLTPIPGLTADAPETDPLSGLTRIAVIQPRGLSPADNVALDDWVRAGGQLLLVLDPMLAGHYELALGDPRRPTDTALIPPVVKRWGLGITFDGQTNDHDHDVERVEAGDIVLVKALAGQIAVTDPAAASCELLAEDLIARCAVGEGEVVLIADATMFEVRIEPTAAPSPDRAQITQVLKFVFGE